jgi:hypothetical protein
MKIVFAGKKCYILRYILGLHLTKYKENKLRLLALLSVYFVNRSYVCSISIPDYLCICIKRPTWEGAQNSKELI